MLGAARVPSPVSTSARRENRRRGIARRPSRAEWNLYTGRAPQIFPIVREHRRNAADYEIVNGLTGFASPAQIVRLWPPSKASSIAMAPGPPPARTPRSPGKPTGMPYASSREAPSKSSSRCPIPSIAHASITAVRHSCRPAPGFYRSTIEVQAGQPSILIEDDTDADLRYTLDIYRGLEPGPGPLPRPPLHLHRKRPRAGWPPVPPLERAPHWRRHSRPAIPHPRSLDYNSEPPAHPPHGRLGSLGV